MGRGVFWLPLLLFVTCQASRDQLADLADITAGTLDRTLIAADPEPDAQKDDGTASKEEEGSGVVGANSETDGAPGMPARKRPFKYHTVNPSQMEREDRLLQKHKDNMRKEYEKLINGGEDEESDKKPESEDRIADAKEKADKAMEVAKQRAKEKSEKTLLKTKERLKKKAAVERQKAKEKAHKKMRAFTPLKGGPIQQAAMARYDAYKKQLLAAHLQAKVAKKEMTKEEVDRVDELAAEALKRAQYYEAQAIKHAIKKEQRAHALRKKELQAEKVMKRADDDAMAKVDEKGEEKEPKWECTAESCKAKCKTEHCLQWCTRCVTLKSEVLKFDPVSDQLVTVGVRSRKIHRPVKGASDFVDEEVSKLHNADQKQKEADNWVDKQLGLEPSKDDTQQDADKEAVAKAGGEGGKGGKSGKGAPNRSEKGAGMQGVQTSHGPAHKSANPVHSPDPRIEVSESKEEKNDDHKVLHWAQGVEKPSTEKEIAAEVHIKIRERQSGMVHAGNKHGDGYLENQPPADLPRATKQSGVA